LYRKAALPSPDAGIGVVVKEALESKPQAQAHLKSEAEAHESIQKHVGVHPALATHLFTARSDAGRLQIATQYVDGVVMSRFAAHLARKEIKGKLSPDDAAQMRRALAKDVLQALAAVSGAGYYHGDVNDNNLIIGNDGVAKLVDFGLARRHGQVPAKAHGAWHPREYAQGTGGDERTDVYMLGVLLKQLFLGQGRLQGVYELPTEECLAPDLRDAIAGMTRASIEDRWTIARAQASPFFNAPIPDENRIRRLIGRLADKSA
jgi:serine/threonine protein kinase